MYLQGTTLHFAFLANFKIPSIVLQYRSAWLRVFLAFNERPLLEGASYQLLGENLRRSFSMRVTIWEWRLTRENAAGSPWLFSVLPEPSKAGGDSSLCPPSRFPPTHPSHRQSPFTLLPPQAIWTNIYLWNLDKDILKFHSVLLRRTLQGTASPPPPFWCRIQSFHSFAEKIKAFSG